MAYNANEDNLPCTPSSNSSNSEESDSEHSELGQSDHKFKFVKKQSNYIPKETQWRIKQHHSENNDNNNNNNNCNNKKRFPMKLVFGIIFSNNYKFQIISLINYNFRNKIINIDKLYEYLLPLLKESNDYKLYHKYGPELFKYSMLRLFQHLSKKQILNEYEINSNFSFKIGVKFDSYRQQLTHKLLKISIENIDIDESDNYNENIDIESDIEPEETEHKQINKCEFIDVQVPIIEMNSKHYNFKTKKNIENEIAEMNENILNHIRFLRLLQKDLTKDNHLNVMIQKKKKKNSTRLKT
eukprot:197251_1